MTANYMHKNIYGINEKSKDEKNDFSAKLWMSFIAELFEEKENNLTDIFSGNVV